MGIFVGIFVGIFGDICWDIWGYLLGYLVQMIFLEKDLGIFGGDISAISFRKQNISG